MTGEHEPPRPAADEQAAVAELAALIDRYGGPDTAERPLTDQLVERGRGDPATDPVPSSARPRRGVAYLSASTGHRDDPPDRVAVIGCEHCGGLVALDQADRHARWHRSAVVVG